MSAVNNGSVLWSTIWFCLTVYHSYASVSDWTVKVVFTKTKKRILSIFIKMIQRQYLPINCLKKVRDVLWHTPDASTFATTSEYHLQALEKQIMWKISYIQIYKAMIIASFKLEVSQYMYQNGTNRISRSFPNSC